MVLVDGKGLPLGVHLSSANDHEMKLAEVTLDTVAVPRRSRGRPRKNPKRIIADKGYDSQALRKAMKRRGIDFIAPHLRNRKNPTQDERKLRRYRRRWKVERTNAWLFTFRRLVVRYDNNLNNYKAFVLFACVLILLRRF